MPGHSTDMHCQVSRTSLGSFCKRGRRLHSGAIFRCLCAREFSPAFKYLSADDEPLRQAVTLCVGPWELVVDVPTSTSSRSGTCTGYERANGPLVVHTTCQCDRCRRQASSSEEGFGPELEALCNQQPSCNMLTDADTGGRHVPARSLVFLTSFRACRVRLCRYRKDNLSNCGRISGQQTLQAICSRAVRQSGSYRLSYLMLSCMRGFIWYPDHTHWPLGQLCIALALKSPCARSADHSECLSSPEAIVPATMRLRSLLDA